MLSKWQVSLFTARAVVFAVVITVVTACVPVAAHPELTAQIDQVTSRIAERPEDGALYLRRGQLHRLHEEWDLALRDLERAEEYGTSTPELLLIRGRTLMGAGRLAEARRDLERLANGFPEIAAGPLAHAELLERMGEYVGAADAYTSAIQTAADPLPETYLARARALGQAKPPSLDAAIHGLDEGLARLGPVVALQLEAVALEERAGRVAEAAERLNRLAAGSARPEGFLVALAELYARAGQTDLAADAADRARAAIRRLPRRLQSLKATGALTERLNSLPPEVQGNKVVRD